MTTPLKNLDNKLVELKQSIDELEAWLNDIKHERELLKVHVNKDDQLRTKQRNLRKEIKAAKNQLNIILDFIKDGTGEDSYSFFPLFAQQTEQPAVN